MGWLLNAVKTDCRHYIGEKPCAFKRTCPGCPNFSPMGARILILKMGAIGDCLRTTPILRELQSAHGQHHVTWVTDAPSAELLQNNPMIDRLVVLDWKTALWLCAQEFDLLYSVDKDPAALALSVTVNAKKKRGYTLDKNGSLTVFDDAGAMALWLGLSDPLKFKRNERVYQDFTMEMLGLPWNEQKYVLELTEEEKQRGRARLTEIGATQKPLIGLNTGAGPVFATKKWPAENFADLARALKQKLDCTLVLLGGPDERERNATLAAELGDLVVDAGCDNPIRLFASMVSKLDLLVTSDTLAMHLAIGADVPTVALFGPTSAAEVSLYGNGLKLTGTPDCAPCYNAVCKEEQTDACMKEITPEQVAEAVQTILNPPDPE